MKKLTSLLVISCLAVISGTAKSFAEDMGAISSGQTKSGQIAVGEEDKWTFSGQAGDRILIDVENTSGSLNSYYRLDPPGGTNEVQGHQWLEHVLKQTGTYTVAVYDSGKDHTGSYNMTFLNLREGDPSAVPISSGQTLAPAGTIAAASDLNVVRFSGEAGDRVLIDMENMSGSVNTYYRLYPPGGGTSELSGNQWQEHVLKETGTYTLVIYDYAADNTGSYNMTFLNLREGDPSAVPISSGQTVSGTIDAPSDIDVVQFSCEARVKVKIDLSPTSGYLNPYFLLYPPDGSTYEAAGHQSLEHVLQQSGTYMVVVYDYACDHIGNYKITLTGDCGGQCALTVSSTEGGSVTSPGEGFFPYDCGTVVPVVASPDAGCAFTGWTGTAVDAGRVANPASAATTVTVDASYTLQANFTSIKRTLTITSGEGGSVTTPGMGAFSYDDGEKVTIVVAPDPNCGFDGWTGTGASKVEPTPDPLTFELTMDDNYTLEAHFAVTILPPEVRTLPVEDVKARSARLVGELVSDGGAACECRFRYWCEGKEGLPTLWQGGYRTGDTFTADISGLTPATTYHYLADARNSTGTTTGDTATFMTGVRLVILPSEPNEGGRVVEPSVAVVELAVEGNVHVLAQAEPNFVFWRWEGTAVDGNKVDDPSSPDTTVLVNWDDTLKAVFLPVRCSRDDLDPALCRGLEGSTSQQWDFGDGADARPEDLYEIDAVPCGGRAPLAGTEIQPLASALAEENQWWATDTPWGSDRKGLLALPAVQCLLYVWPSIDTVTTVRVQCVWQAYDEDETGSPGSPTFVVPEDLNPPSLVQETALEQGWRHSTYVWTVSPSPKAISFILRGRIVVDTLIIDTCPGPGVIHVDDDAPLDPGPNDITISDPLENGTPEHPFDSIQEGINAITGEGTVIVHAGRYVEAIQVPAKDISITAEWLADPSVMAASILDAGGTGPAVTFTGLEGANCWLEGLTIVRAKSPTGAAILCEHANPVISHCLISGNMATAANGTVIVCRDSNPRFINCTISGNRAGVGGTVLSFAQSKGVVLNSIVWDNDGSAILVESGLAPQVLYSDIEGGVAGLGILDLDPLFAEPGYWQDNGTADPSDDTWIEGDYHLLSQRGRLDPEAGAWVLDSESSPCIDAGDLESFWQQEPEPHGDRINMGTYGGTSQASKSP